MTIVERWEAWEQASPREKEIMVAWFMGCCGADFDAAAAHAKKVAAQEAGR